MLIEFEQRPQELRISRGRSLMTRFTCKNLTEKQLARLRATRRLNFQLYKDLCLPTTNTLTGHKSFYYLRVLGIAHSSELEPDPFISTYPKVVTAREFENTRFKLWWDTDTNTFFTFNGAISKDLQDILNSISQLDINILRQSV